ncbi:unnamed protein product [Eruca vesicaria subsp. sativa]|uniref:Uncharacterized protein n=1 Tax=Eruca vesicaria subsp. sativa TaxID=29727 RepID=A0ABC8IMW9_ERUVS|nr:unnamed protein product [Eruca vesicaria subsp. sativa]
MAMDMVCSNRRLGGKGNVMGDGDKKKGVRKCLFKSSSVAGASSKSRMVQALIATRKRTINKPASHQGEVAKQKEEKGPSNPKTISSKL